jgi:hypothetical protein
MIALNENSNSAKTN